MNITEQKSLNYRKDIQGLRGFAVLAVLADHFAPDIRQTSGGFVGVDIFFVISGFLITSIILRELENDEFTLINFWKRRIKRIFPNLIVMLTISTFLLWTVSTEYVRSELLINLAKATTFSSNIGYSTTQDYFSGQKQNPLLHLWSLAIEEQFYLLWPLLCFALYRINKKFILYFSYAIFLMSLITNWVYVFYFENKSDAFYYSHARIWELILGAILAQHLRKKTEFTFSSSALFNQLLSFSGMLLIFISLIVITQDSAFPGYIALLPTLGTVAILGAGPQNFLNKFFLTNPILIWFGGISYALYLWHYPLLFLMRTIKPGRTDFVILGLTFMMSLIFAYVSTRFVESPFRKGFLREIPSTSLLATMSVIIVLALLSQHFTIDKSDPNFVLERYSARGWGNQSDLECLRLREEITVRTLKRQGCMDLPKARDKFVVLVGDSHSGSLRSGLKPYFKSKGITLKGVSTGWCGWYQINPLDDDKICSEITKEFLDFLAKSNPEVLIISGYWAKMSRAEDVEKSLVQYINFVQSLGVKKVVVVGQVPTYEDGLPRHLQNVYLKNNLPIPKLTPRTQVKADPKGTQEHMKSYDFPSDVLYRSIDKILCLDNLCRVTVGSNLSSDLIVWDYGHLTESGALFVSEALFADIERLIND